MVRFLKYVVMFILLNKVIAKLYHFDKYIIELHYMSGTPHMWAHAYMLRVGGVSPQREIEQIHEGFHPKRTIPSNGEVCPSTYIKSIKNMQFNG